MGISFGYNEQLLLSKYFYEYIGLQTICISSVAIDFITDVKLYSWMLYIWINKSSLLLKKCITVYCRCMAFYQHIYNNIIKKETKEVSMHLPCNCQRICRSVGCNDIFPDNHSI